MKNTMKKIKASLTLVLALLLTLSMFPAGALSIAASAAGENLFVNGDLETGDKTGWTLLSGAVVSADAAKDGGFGLYTPAGNTYSSGVIKATVDPNSTYIFSCDFKSPAGDAPLIYFKHQDASGTDKDQFDKSPAADGSNWTHFEWTVESGEYTKLKFQLCAGWSATEKYFDNVTLVKVGSDEPEEPEIPDEPEEPEVENLIVNGDFETGDLTDWVLLGGSEVKADAAKDGGFGLCVPAGKSSVVKPIVEANTTYIFSCDFKSSAGVKPVIYFKHMEGTTDVDQTEWYPEPDGANWTHFSVEVNSDVYTKLKFQLCAGNKTETHFDNVSLVKKATEPEEPEIPDEPEEPEVENLIVNGDFETGDLTDWVLLGGSEVKAEAAKDGGFGLYVPAGKSSVVKPIVEANTTYIFSCDFKSSAGVKPVIYFKHMEGTTDVDQTEWYPEPDGANWTHFSVEVNSDVYTKLKFQLCAGNKTETHFDNVSLVKKATEPEEPEEPEDPVVENLIANGDFETGDGTDWVLLGGSEVKAEAAKSGNYGLYVPAGSAFVGGVAKPIVEANTTYIFSFDFKSPAGDKPLVYFKHMDGTTDVDQTEWYPEPDGANWTHYSVEVNSGAYTKLKFQLYAGDKATEKYFDNVTLVKVGTAEPEEPGVEPSFDGYITNGDFETGDYTGWGGASNMQIATTNVHSGKYAAMVSGKQWSGLLQKVKVIPNTDYKYTFWVRYEYGLNEQTLFVKAGDKNLSNHAIKPGKLGDWTKYEIAINSGEYTELSLQFCITGNEEAVLVYDDVSFTQVGGITFDGYLYNGSFETGDKTKWNGGSSFEIVTDAQDGAFALHITGDNWANMGQQIPTKANTDYTVVLWAKKAKGSGQFALLYKDENQTKNVDQFYIDPTDDWAEYKWTFNTGEYANGYFRIMADSSTNTAYVDNISIVEGVPSVLNGLIANGDFETGDLTDWENINSESVVVNTDKQGGEYALHLKGKQWSAVRQTVATEKNTDYVLTFYVKRLAGFDKMAVWLKDGDNNLLNSEGKEIGLEYAVTESNGWLKVEHIFNSYNQTQVDVLFGMMADGNEVLIDNIYLDVYEKPAVEPLVLYSWGQVANRPYKASDNLIVNGSFESAEGAQWNTAGFINEYVSVVEDATAKDGNKVLYFNSLAATEKTMYVFWVDVEPNTNYTFSAFVKGAFMSRENRCTATFGVVDPDEMTFLIYDGEKGKNSKEYYQMVPPSWDNVWHLRSVAFNSGEKTKIGIAVYGVASQMYLDDIALFKSDAGAKYTASVMTDVVSTNILSKHAGCDPQDNLVGNFNLNDVEDTFWSAGYGWKNGTLCIREDEYGYGSSLQYTASDNPVGIHYIRWIDVEPNTAYTFSVDLLVQESGNGYLALIDSKPSKPVQFINLQFSTDVFGEEWIKFYIDFNTGCYERIGIAIVDKGGQALLDNIRIFKAVDGKDVIDDFVAAKTGWEKDGSKWIYFEDGDQVYGKWIQDGGAWYYIGADGYMVANKWMKDSKGWCWLTSSGKMAVNAWVMDSKGWCYVGDDGYCVTNTWKKDSVGWCYLDENGSMVKNDWVVDGNDWYLLDANGYMVANKWVHDGFGWVYLEGSGRLAVNKWVKDSAGWCYLGADGYMVTDKWIKDSVGWCYVGADGYCVTNAWKKDSKGWVYLDGSGRMVTNKWVKDSVGWCYVSADGYAVTNCWKKDSIGWCYLNANGSMTKNGWVYDGGQWYYLDGNGYMVVNKSLTIKDKTYHFNTFGVCTNP